MGVTASARVGVARAPITAALPNGSEVFAPSIGDELTTLSISKGHEK
jgi:hypothetical protein